jgi:uncharacterized BrkB/YihY/UPF0761 family membrane protein
MRLPWLRGIHPTELVWHTCKQFINHDIPHHAAAVTYYILFSLFPFAIFFLALLGTIFWHAGAEASKKSGYA